MASSTIIRARITHVIFDMDGLLLDTERVYTEATQIILDRYGKKFEWELKKQMMGRRAIDAGRLLVETLQIPLSAEQYLEEREVLQNERFPLSQPLPGAKELVQHLHSKGIPIAVATSSYGSPFALKTQNHDSWFALFNTVVKGDDDELKRGKPAPDIFLLAAQRLGAKPENCLVFEDAVSGIEAAHAAGMHSVWVPDAQADRDPVTLSKASLVLNSIEEFEPVLWDLPSR